MSVLAMCVGAVLVAADDRTFACACELRAATAWRQRHFDEATGRDLRNYPPHRSVDFTHMRLEIMIDDMDVPRLEAVQTLEMTPIAGPVGELTLDANLLDIESMTCDRAEVSWVHEGRDLRVSFRPPLPRGEAAALVTTYSVTDPAQGLIWTPSSEAWPGRPAQLHTQGQPESNSSWFPCHDFPHERLTTELIVTVPPGFVVSANGRLASRQKRVESGEASAAGYETFHWVQDAAHPNYLVSMVVGQFDIVDVGTTDLPMPVYVPPGRGDDVERTYGRTGEMAELYAGLFDEPYPWDRYAQLVVWNFAAGGMENTSATTLFGTAVFDEQSAMDHSLEALIAHELAHQWFGDLLTCRSWEHIWLNEGFATYLESLWWEHVDGEAGYLDDVQMNMDAVIEADVGAAPGVPGMASKVYEHPWDVFDRGANPYPKGASILHMLRRQLGDEVFFESIRVYVDRFKGESVETHDLRKVMEEVSGEALEQFFIQWCERPGVPHLNVDVAWEAGELRIDIEQVQVIDGDNPAYAFDLPVWIADASGERWSTIHVDERMTEAVFELAAEPYAVCVNPHLDVLAEITVDQPWHRWRAQLAGGPTLAARVQAVRALGTFKDEMSPSLASVTERETERLLTAVASDTSAHERLRVEALKALAARGDVDVILTLLEQGIVDHAVRRAAVDALADALEPPAQGRASDVVTRLALADDSTRVRSAALRAMGRLQIRDLGVLALALETDSQHDQLRQASIEAFGDLDAPEGLDIAIRLAQPGTLGRTRAKAIATIAILAHHEPSKAYYALEGLIEDRERRAWEAAVEAIVATGDPRGVEALAALAASKRDADDRAWVTAQAILLGDE